MRRKRILLVLLSFISLLGVSSLVYRGFFALTPPELEEAADLFSELRQAESYSFSSQAYLTTNGEVRDYYLLFGERAGEDAHINGTVLGTPVELYLVNGVLYQKSGSGQWRVSPAPDVDSALTLFAELDPVSAFSFSGVDGFTYLGVEETEQGRAYVVELLPRQTGWVEQYFTDAKYTVWISLRGRELLRSQLTATLREDGDSRLTISAELYDVNEKIAIRLPDEALLAGAREEEAARRQPATP